jgi:hypothetical protein
LAMVPRPKNGPGNIWEFYGRESHTEKLIPILPKPGGVSITLADGNPFPIFTVVEHGRLLAGVTKCTCRSSAFDVEKPSLTEPEFWNFSITFWSAAIAPTTRQSFH